MKRFRKILFWIHLVAGLIAGVAIGIMCFTGVVLAFEHELVNWAERDARRVSPPTADAPRLPLEELRRGLREARPDFRATGITLSADPHDAVTFSAGRDSTVYADPYTGQIHEPGSTRLHDFMHTMVDWHRYLALSGDHRATGKLVNGIANLAFLALAITGLYLWWPRRWSWHSLKAVALVNRRLVGKARDFNWHNALGLWSAPVLIVLTLTAVPISFRWGNDLIYRLVGETPPPPGTRGTPGPEVEIPRPSPGTRPLPYDTVVARVQQEFPRWETISLRSGNPQRGRPAPNPEATAVAAPGLGPTERPSPPPQDSPRQTTAREGERATPQPLTITVRESGSWPRTATSTLTLDPYTGATLARTGFADLSTARQIRTWTRFLHTGQALGWWGQLFAGLASLAGCVLVYTGFALSWRRFFRRPPATPQ